MEMPRRSPPRPRSRTEKATESEAVSVNAGSTRCVPCNQCVPQFAVSPHAQCVPQHTSSPFVPDQRSNPGPESPRDRLIREMSVAACADFDVRKMPDKSYAVVFELIRYHANDLYPTE